MTTKTTNIMEGAYKALKREKKANESFTDTILRLTNRGGSVSEYFRSWKVSRGETERIKKEIDVIWKNWGHHEIPR